MPNSLIQGMSSANWEAESGLPVQPGELVCPWCGELPGLLCCNAGAVLCRTASLSSLTPLYLTCCSSARHQRGQVFAFALHLDSSEILRACLRQCYACPEQKYAGGKDLTLRTNSCCAVLLYGQNDLIYRKVNVFVTCLGISQHFFYDNEVSSFGFT